MEKLRLLVVEDEVPISSFVCMELEHEGYIAEPVYDGREAVDKIRQDMHDLILLDIGLPNLNGIEVLRRTRKISNVPIIMLTARDDIIDKVTGLDCGANDYITKPFAIEELLARIRVIIRDRKDSKVSNDSRFVFEDIIMDLERHTVTKAGQTIELTKKEYDVLCVLLKNKNMVIEREVLISTIWGENFTGDTNLLDVYIRHLRIKIDGDSDRKIINTVRGVGFMIGGKEV